MTRYVQGDWGELFGTHDIFNDLALVSGQRVHAVYHSESGQPFWVCTENDSTVISLPGEDVALNHTYVLPALVG
jgi:hypothetical protein